MQGWRNTMEDSHIAEVDLGNGVSFFGVYDGHGGKQKLIMNSTNRLFVGNEVADYVRDHLISELKQMESFKNGNYEQALADIYLKMDELI